jgi:hypothetical protein
MKREFATTLSVAAIAITVLIPQLAQARTMDDSKAEPADIPSTMPVHEKAQLMVPAQAALPRTLDARRAQPGQQFRVSLSKAVQLKDGPELPRGTELVGTVATDPAAANDKSKMELRFTQAELKSGKVVPIIATIVGFYGPESEISDGHSVRAGNQEPNTWNSELLEIHQIEPETGVELHSKISDENSGTLTSRKGAVKLPAGSEFALAIAVQKIR